MPLTRLDRVKRVWERALPHRVLELCGSTVEARPAGGGATYKAAAMSDGERVAFYGIAHCRIAHCLTAPPGSVIVIDEPELRLHWAVQAQLALAAAGGEERRAFALVLHDARRPQAEPTPWQPTGACAR